MKHTHDYIIYPLTAKEMGHGREVIFGCKVACSICQRKPPIGTSINKMAQSFYKELIPEALILEKPYVYGVTK